jgi:hypothetical protein
VSILTQPRGRLDAGKAEEPPLRQIIDVLEQVMCTRDAEKLAIAVLEICEDGQRSHFLGVEQILKKTSSFSNVFQQRSWIPAK